jgi:hypothetical protein
MLYALWVANPWPADGEFSIYYKFLMKSVTRKVPNNSRLMLNFTMVVFHGVSMTKTLNLPCGRLTLAAVREVVSYGRA